ncbi:hypothetical protein H257_14659 [Aphanomyces astaci]|uniref:Uncharacterized protein n=1 Tax=Aphanomyces astaci TaxID=112090 RepID=W4FRR3_APHAT|nr:hypothetical protein H257_14659 [Aphanomyces astaci]ETV69636.1 hypothetical protein H257_14659 [Aphanomyces astaci]|eukprot:XP_009840852.1 hypothetical protein H257_14659 [Aphanomyces astaci]
MTRGSRSLVTIGTGMDHVRSTMRYRCGCCTIRRNTTRATPTTTSC